MVRKRVAIIGAGCSGLTSIKACLEYGLEPVCFERSSDIGGLWRYREGKQFDNEGCVMHSTVINTSKEMMAFSDFPPDPKLPNFMHNRDVLQYMRDYVEEFNLMRYIQFNVETTTVKKAEDFEATGRWIVTYKQILDQTDVSKCSSPISEVFDGVMICTGHHSTPYVPKEIDLSNYNGEMLHSHYYSSYDHYKGKTVMVIGMGNSGGDIAVELSHKAKKVYLVTRRGIWLNGRIAAKGIPYDLLIFTRVGFGAYYTITALTDYVAQGFVYSKVDLDMYGLTPEHRHFGQHPFINDGLPTALLTGGVSIVPEVARVISSDTVKSGVSSITSTMRERNGLYEGSKSDKGAGVAVLRTGELIEGIDSVILATGYSIAYPYLKDDDVRDAFTTRSPLAGTGSWLGLYHYMYAPQLGPQAHTLAAIGLIQPYGSIIPIAELQARVYASMLAGHATLPPKSAMEDHITAMIRFNDQKYVASQRHSIQVDLVPYMDELADLIDCKPAKPIRFLAGLSNRVCDKLISEVTKSTAQNEKSVNSVPKVDSANESLKTNPKLSKFVSLITWLIMTLSMGLDSCFTGLLFFLQDPVLAYSIGFGPILAYHYRIRGPNAWPRARDATLSFLNRVKFPVWPRNVGKKGPTPEVNGYIHNEGANGEVVQNGHGVIANGGHHHYPEDENVAPVENGISGGVHDANGTIGNLNEEGNAAKYYTNCTPGNKVNRRGMYCDQYEEHGIPRATFVGSVWYCAEMLLLHVTMGLLLASTTVTYTIHNVVKYFRK